MTEYKPTNLDYKLEAYNPEWVGQYEKAKNILQVVFGYKMLQIEHVGSTSIVGMMAKPVIDILIIVSNVSDIKFEMEKMCNLGYMGKENYLAKDSYFFCKEVDGNRVENIHIFPIGHPRIASFIDKRDYLRSHPEEVAHYEDVKRVLAKEYPNDYRSYAKGKGDYLNSELVAKINIWKNTSL
jgi:GrpB-like predicted nucleotidyltransferase (UPF0157 family)